MIAVEVFDRRWGHAEISLGLDVHIVFNDSIASYLLILRLSALNHFLFVKMRLLSSVASYL